MIPETMMAQSAEIIHHCEVIIDATDSLLSDDDQYIITIIRDSAQKINWLTRENLRYAQERNLNQRELQGNLLFDLRGPINNIFGGSKILLQADYQANLRSDQRQHLQAIVTIAEHTLDSMDKLQNKLRTHRSSNQDNPT